MTPEDLYGIAEQARKDGKFKTESVQRCGVRNCRIIGTYSAENGRSIHIAGPIRLSPGKAEEVGLPRRIEGRAWFAGEPRTEWVGCRHSLIQVELP